jgi:hypothetical protein
MRSHTVLTTLGLCLLASCGRLGFDPAPPPADEPPDAPPPPVEAKLSVTAEATDLPAGTSVFLELALEPPPVPGTAFELKTSGGILLDADAKVAGDSLVIPVTPEGTVAPVRLHVPIDATPGEVIHLSSDVPTISGDVEYLIKDPRLHTLMVDEHQYELAKGFVIEHVPLDPAAAEIIGARSGRLAFPPPGSAFGAEPYLALAGTPPEILRLDGESLISFAVSPGVPDEGIAQIAFADPAGPHGDVLFVCSASIDSGDGIFTVKPDAEWKPWREFNNCNGLAIDHDLVSGDPGVPAPIYVNVDSTIVERVHADAVTVETLTTELPFGSAGFALFLNREPPFATGLYLVFAGTTAPGEDGRLMYLDGAVAETPEFKLLTDGLPGPEAAFFGAGTQFGGLFYLFMGLTGEIHVLRPDGTNFVFMSGILGPADLAIDPRDRSLWILESGQSHLLRVRPELPLPL